MKQLAYSSGAAFLAHYWALTNARAGGLVAFSTEDRETLDVMCQLVKALTSEERTILLADPAGDDSEAKPGAIRRRRERAQLKLRRLLLAAGIVH